MVTQIQISGFERVRNGKVHKVPPYKRNARIKLNKPRITPAKKCVKVYRDKYGQIRDIR